LNVSLIIKFKFVEVT